MRAAEADGLLAIDLGAEAPDQVRERIEECLRTHAAGEASWEEGRRAVFTLRPESFAPAETTADKVLRAALEVRDLPSLTPVSLACDVIERSAREEERALTERLLSQWVEKYVGEIVMTRHVVESRVAREVSVESVAGATEALFRVLPGTPARVAPIGRWVVPLHDGGWENVSAVRALFDGPAIENGVLRPERVKGALDASELLRAGADVVEVIAPAWMGKTYLARTLEGALQRIGTSCHLTSLEHREGGHIAWPDEAFLRENGERVWIVDALDEGKAREAYLKPLGAASAHSGLRTIILGRADERARALLDELSLRRDTFELLPMDGEAVLRDVCDGDAERFEHLLAAAQEMSLDHWLSFAEWEELDRELRQDGTEIDARTLRERMLERRCSTLRRGRVRDLPATTKMLNAARWLAALVATSGAERFAFGSGGHCDVLRVVPDELIEAVQALRDTVTLARTGGRDGDEWDFAAAHLVEDLAASFFAEEGRLERIAAGDDGKQVPLGEQRLRRLFTDGVSVRPGLARIIARTDQLTEEALSRRLVPHSCDARKILDAVFAAARAVGDELPWVLGQSELAHLGSALTPDYARDKLAENDASVTSRHLALRLAAAAGWTSDLAADAITIALDGAEHIELRQLAARVALEDFSGLPALERLIGDIDRDVDDSELAKLRTMILGALLERGCITRAVAIPLTSGPDENRWDDRKLFLAGLRDGLDLTAARAVIDDLRAEDPASLRHKAYDPEALSAAPLLPRAASRIAPAVREELAPRAARILLTAPTLAPEDLERVAFIAMFPDSFAGWRDNGSVYDSLREVVKRSEVRRFLYERLNLRGLHSPYFALHLREDAAWLIERAGQVPERSNNVHRELYSSVQWLRGSGQSQLAAQGEALLRGDGVWEELEAAAEKSRRAVEEFERENAAWREERRNRIERAMPLSALVPNLLADEREASVRLHVLGDVVFGARHAAHNVLGSYDDLSKETQQKLIEAARRALEEATPSELPAGSTFSATLLDEAAAFRAVAMWKREAGWLDPVLVQKWLPVALFGSSSGTDDLLEILERCHEAAPVETIATLVGEMRREARRGFATLAHRVPECARRDPRLSAGVEALARELAAEPAKAGVGALTSLLQLYLDTGAPRTRERRLFEDLVEHTNPRVACAAAGAWLSRKPGDAYAAAARRIVDEVSAKEILTPVAFNSHEIGLAHWPAEALAALTTRLANVIPLDDDAPIPHGFHVVSTREELQVHRRSFINHCFARSEEPAIRAALDALATLSPAYGVQAQRTAWHFRDVVDTFRRPRPSMREVAECLRSGLRFLADEADLAMTIRELLEEPWDPTWHMLLYESGGKRRHEGAVQSLLHAVVTQKLERATLPAAVAVIREPLNRGSNEPDFEIRAGAKLVVPIEVKWDNHPKWKAALREQLAERYCKAHRHGVYVVATAERDPDEIRAALEEEVRAVARDLGITVHVVVKDVREGRWPQAQVKAEGKRAAAKPKKKDSSTATPQNGGGDSAKSSRQKVAVRRNAKAKPKPRD